MNKESAARGNWLSVGGNGKEQKYKLPSLIELIEIIRRNKDEIKHA